MAIEVSMRSSQLLSDSSSLNVSSAELVDDVAVATGEVMELDRAVTSDQDAIAETSSVARDTITLTADIMSRITTINVR